MQIKTSNCRSPQTRIPTEFSSNPIKPTISFTKKSTQVLKEAVAALDSIAKRGSKVRPKTYISLLQSCIDSDSIEQGRKLHARIGVLGELDPFVETKLVSMYAKCGSLDDARRVFGEMRNRDLFSWSAMIGAYSREQRWRDIACANLGDAETGKLIQSLVVRSGMGSCVHVNNSVLAMYAKCGRLSSARWFFEKMDRKDRVTWDSIISGYCQSGENVETLRLFDRMQVYGIEPGLITWNILIASYNQTGNCDVAMELMKKMENLGISPDVFTWTSMISGFAQNNLTNQALELFREMLEGVEPNGVTITSLISACASLKALKKGKELHSAGVKIGSTGDVLVGNSLIDMYSKCGKLEAAQRVFDKILHKDVFTWKSMIGGYAQAGYCGKAYDLFMKMQESGVRPNVVTWNVMISGYIQNGDEDQAMDLFHRMETDGMIKRNTASWNSLIVAAKKVKEIHGCELRRSLESDLSVANSLIDTYAKSGDIVCARSIFDGMPSKDIISWNSLISGYVLHGFSSIAIDLFDQMREVGLKPNRGTFANIILAYSLTGMVDEGKQTFSSMTEYYQISPGLEHYLAMIDLFGRSGRFREATEFIEEMAIESDPTVWVALLKACRVHGNIGLAVRTVERLIKLEPGNSAVYRLMLQIYALGGSWIEVKNTVHTLVTGDQSKPNLDSLYSGLDSITEEIKVLAPDSNDMRLCIEEEEKKEIVGIHSEKLAIAFSLICSPYASRSIRIVKDLRTANPNLCKISEIVELQTFLPPPPPGFVGFFCADSRISIELKMFLTRTEYDRGVNTFSPEGRLFQVEYAIEAIKLGSTAIGLKTKEGVVLAVEKRITSPLLEPSSVEKIMEIDEHIGCAMSGLIADARTLVEHARVETQNHRFSYGEPMTVESTTQALCDLALRFGEGDEESMVITAPIFFTDSYFQYTGYMMF
ncbi:hypothetical protein HHK36_014471 [Tetracentron sinense]|uniref:Proteasome alpha-type subunits domain-containing protein n=1 Tax=Tetracentron sinense TaxID=13715 RepID=A0A834ZET9_TETSI|nr:hypothetical protein HHK36_014471 [Tetracentron sinense]